VKEVMAESAKREGKSSRRKYGRNKERKKRNKGWW
jgi:hypothetical protein